MLANVVGTFPASWVHSENEKAFILMNFNLIYT